MNGTMLETNETYYWLSQLHKDQKLVTCHKDGTCSAPFPPGREPRMRAFHARALVDNGFDFVLTVDSWHEESVARVWRKEPLGAETLTARSASDTYALRWPIKNWWRRYPAAQPLPDGPLVPHEMREHFFLLYREFENYWIEIGRTNA